MEEADSQHFLLFRQCFLKSAILELLEYLFVLKHLTFSLWFSISTLCLINWMDFLLLSHYICCTTATAHIILIQISPGFHHYWARALNCLADYENNVKKKHWLSCNKFEHIYNFFLYLKDPDKKKKIWEKGHHLFFQKFINLFITCAKYQHFPHYFLSI